VLGGNVLHTQSKVDIWCCCGYQLESVPLGRVFRLTALLLHDTAEWFMARLRAGGPSARQLSDRD